MLNGKVCQGAIPTCPNYAGNNPSHRFTPQCGKCAIYYHQPQMRLGQSICVAGFVRCVLFGGGIMATPIDVVCPTCSTHYGNLTVYFSGPTGPLNSPACANEASPATVTVNLSIDSLCEQLMAKTEDEKQRAYKLLYASGCRINRG